jgi:hypothetical protein
MSVHRVNINKYDGCTMWMSDEIMKEYLLERKKKSIYMKWTVLYVLTDSLYNYTFVCVVGV